MGKGGCLTSGCSVAELTSDYPPSTLPSRILLFITHRSCRHMSIAMATLFSTTRGRRIHLLLLPRSRAQALCRRLPHRKAGQAERAMEQCASYARCSRPRPRLGELDSSCATLTAVRCRSSYCPRNWFQHGKPQAEDGTYGLPTRIAGIRSQSPSPICRRSSRSSLRHRFSPLIRPRSSQAGESPIQTSSSQQLTAWVGCHERY